jgi:hypothetical protein
MCPVYFVPIGKTGRMLMHNLTSKILKRANRVYTGNAHYDW